MDKQTNRLAPCVLAVCALVCIYVVAVVVPGKSPESAEWLRLAGGWMVPATIVLLLTMPQILDSRESGVWSIINTVFAVAVLDLMLFFLAATFALW